MNVSSPYLAVYNSGSPAILNTWHSKVTSPDMDNRPQYTSWCAPPPPRCPFTGMPSNQEAYWESQLDEVMLAIKYPQHHFIGINEHTLPRLTGASKMPSLWLVSHGISLLHSCLPHFSTDKLLLYIAHVGKVIHVLGRQDASHFDLAITVSFTSDFNLTVFLC